MPAPHLKGTIEAVEVSARNNPTWRSTLYDVTVGGETIAFFDTKKVINSSVTVGDAVAVWKNEKDGKTSFNITKDKPYSGGGGAPSAAPSSTTPAAKAGYTPRSDQQASITAQNALNRGVDIMGVVVEAMKVALQNDPKAVTKAQLKLLTDPDYVMEQAVHQGNRVHKLLMAGDLSQELPKFDAEPEFEDEPV
mgnify:CR=1 FL=1|tara:strand:+ start:2736 stop:3314 length:579 start_codon:yes stop_codon:yes gene_type:complete